MTTRALIFAIVLAAAGAASAQEPPENLAAARTIIDRAQLGDVFEPFEDDQISTRHAASGLICHFYPDDTRSEVVIFTASRPRGQDVGCIRDREDQATTLYATRYEPQISAEQALAQAEAAIRQRFGDAQPTPASLVMSSEALPPTLVAHYLITLRGERWLTSVLVAQSGEWIIKLRVTRRAVDAQGLLQAELEANAMMTAALLEQLGLQRVPETPPQH